MTALLSLQPLWAHSLLSVSRMLVLSFFSFFLAFAVAAPAITSLDSSSSSSTTQTIHITTSSRPSTRHLSHFPPKTSRTVQSPQIIQPGFTPPTHTFPHTFRPKPSAALPSPSPVRSGQKPISIAFEVLGGLFVAALLLGLLRCCHNYRKTPHRDRIADILQRHHLQRELEELERNPAILRRPSLREPAPPYFPRPPSYDDTNPFETVRATSRSQYSAVVTNSPPPSPPMSQVRLPISTIAARSPPDLIPSMPNG